MESQNLTPTPASEWKSQVRLEGQDVQLPSGNVARCRRISPQAFLGGGHMPDPLSAIVRKAIHTNQGNNPAALEKELSKIADDPETLVSALEMFDRVLTFVMVEPQVQMPPPCDVPTPTGLCGEYANTEVHKNPHQSGMHAYHEGERDPNVLYADVVDMEDKMFLFQWALAGTGDAAKFREELDGTVESLSNSKDVQDQAV